MTKSFKYTPDDRMVTLIADDYRLIQVMSRFGIRVGFGDKTVAEVCNEANVDCSTFLTIVNFITGAEDISDEAIQHISLASLLQYLRQTHIYFLEYCLPEIRRKLLDGIQFRTTDISFLILKFFDENTHEIRSHMEYEEQFVFEYVRNLLNGNPDPQFKISTYSDHHEEVTYKLKELKTLIIRYCPEGANVNLLNSALYDIYRCEEELQNHCLVEDAIFVPSIQALEASIDYRKEESEL